MEQISFCTIGNTKALCYAKQYLQDLGYEITSEIQDQTTHVLLPVPSLDQHGNIIGGPSYADTMKNVQDHVTIMGGFLPATKNRTIDFLKDAHYLAENAAITAHCAVRIALNNVDQIIQGTSVLVMGWGRIGKCLADLLRKLGANVTVAARKESDRAMLIALGYEAIHIQNIQYNAYSIVFNTIPSPVIQINELCNGIIAIDLASTKGIEGTNVLWERGLPNRLAPKSSGKLIAEVALRYSVERSSL